MLSYGQVTMSNIKQRSVTLKQRWVTVGHVELTLMNDE